MDTPFDPTLESDIKELMKEVPPPIRAFFASGKVETVAKSLMLKYQLHIDQGAILEREMILLLLGLKNPTEFVQTLLEEGKLDNQTINDIVQDVNAQIFVPLREEVRRGAGDQAPARPEEPASGAAAEPPRRESQVQLPPLTTIIPANPQLPARPAPMLTSVPRYVPPKKYFHLQNKIPPPPPSPTVREGSLTSLNPAKLLEDHEEPHLDIRTAKTTETPLRQALRTVLPPKNLPGAMPPPLNVPRGGTSGEHSAKQNVVAAKPYSSDPYREPIDEK